MEGFSQGGTEDRRDGGRLTATTTSSRGDSFEGGTMMQFLNVKKRRTYHLYTF